VALVIVILQLLLVVKMLIAPIAIIVSRALDPVLLQGVPGIEVDLTVAAVMGHGRKMEVERWRMIGLFIYEVTLIAVPWQRLSTFGLWAL
jgi:hypothetical protein